MAYRRRYGNRRRFRSRRFRRYNRRTRFNRRRRFSKRRTYRRRSDHHDLIRYTPTSIKSVPGDGVSNYHFEAWTFTLTSVPGYTTFAGMYDRYMITRVKIYMEPMVNVNSQETYAAGVQPPVVATYIDLDDNQTPISENQFLFSPQTKWASWPKKIKRSFVPAILGRVYENNTNDGYQIAKRKWIDTSDVSVPHYGVKLMIKQTGSPGSGKPIGYRCYVKYWVRFAGLKYAAVDEDEIFMTEPGQPIGEVVNGLEKGFDPNLNKPTNILN